MARRKIIREEPISKSTVELAAKIRAYIQGLDLLDAQGNQISDFDPVLYLAGVAARPDVPIKIRTDAARVVATYLYPQQKSVQTTPPAKPVVVRLRNFGGGPDEIRTIDGKVLGQVPHDQEDWDVEEVE